MSVITIDVLLNPDIPEQFAFDTKKSPILPKDEAEDFKLSQNAPQTAKRINSQDYDAVLEIKSEFSESVTKIPLRQLYYEKLTKPTSRRSQTSFPQDKILLLPGSGSNSEPRDSNFSTVSCLKDETPNPISRTCRFRRILSKPPPAEPENINRSTSLPAPSVATPTPSAIPHTANIPSSQRDEITENKLASPKPSTPNACSQRLSRRKRKNWWHCEIAACKKIFTNKREYEKHLSKAHKYKSTQCEICGGKLGRKDYLRDHVRSKRHILALAKVQARSGK
ncbi:hypothetical protein AA313_de0205230 [Arthrobotrys entomopaga]|nr:hypothetical protein AA313_de0205230 [Arthrobotrys entomopaga]